jgi:Pvc16 N-terminal domain
VELAVRLETLGLNETSLIWEGLERSYQLSISYEVTVVVIASALAPFAVTPVGIAKPQYAIGAPGAA